MKRFAWLLSLIAFPAFAQQHCDAGQFWSRSLESLQAENCNFKQADARGFSAYDIAGLRGQKDMQQWLVAEKFAQEGQYSPALIKLVQTGLRYLGHDAGIINGQWNPQTTAAIKAHQKSLSLAATGRVQADWLGAFYRQITRKIQKQFLASGIDIGTADGIIGAQTRQAMQQFRRKHHLPVANYAHIDDQLIYRLMMEETESMKKQITAPKAPPSAAKNDKNAAKTAKPAAKNDKNAAKAPAKSASNAKSASKTPNTAKNDKAPAKTNSKAAKSASNTKSASNKNSAPAPKGNSTAKRRATPAKTPTRPSPEQVLAEQRRAQLAEEKRNQSSTRVSKKGGFAKVSGRLNGSGSGCNIGGQRIDGSWCSSYASSKGSLCSALLDGSGKVFSLTCGKKK